MQKQLYRLNERRPCQVCRREIVFAATGIDPHEDLPSSVRRYESKPQPDWLAVEAA